MITKTKFRATDLPIKSNEFGIPWRCRKIYLKPGDFVFTVPESINILRAVVFGAGGCSFYDYSSAQKRGGGGGGYTEAFWECEPGQNISVIVGDVANISAIPGGTSSVQGPGVSLTAFGGNGGNVSTNPGKGGSGSGGLLNANGGNGGAASLNGGSAGSWLGNGGNGTSTGGGGIGGVLPYGKGGTAGIYGSMCAPMSETGKGREHLRDWWDIHDIDGLGAVSFDSGEGFPAGPGGGGVDNMNAGILGGGGRSSFAGLAGGGGSRPGHGFVIIYY